ncbi:hypothetical protein DUI87_18487 [Hirundo rustica rustica]|uniref:Uncharacterized protein n=1 Tax=Hirundo rustica rustica TaxID=333673 RepID=A0A3M0K218_HIRRU|nr:hypothetical protein DUI87_18487 [Hirundo rustica rustica]
MRTCRNHLSVASTEIRQNGWCTGKSVVLPETLFIVYADKAGFPVEKWLVLLLGWPYLANRDQHLPAASTAVLLAGLNHPA